MPHSLLDAADRSTDRAHRTAEAGPARAADVARATHGPSSSFAEPASASDQDGPRERFLRAYVAALEGERLRWCVLRGHASFPSPGPGRDLDLLVHPRDADRASTLALELARAHGVSTWEHRRAGFLEQFHFHAYAGPGKHAFFGLDLHRWEACFGVPWLGADDVLARTELDGSLRRSDPAIAACVNAIGALLSGGAIPERHARELRAALASDRSGVEAVLARAFGARLATRVLAVAAEREDFGARLDVRSLRRALWLRSFARHPWASLTGAATHAWHARVAPWIAPRGRFFALLGTDGSGKSTVLAGIQAELRSSFGDGSVHSFHLRPGLLPQLNALFHGGRTTYTLEDMSDPHRARPSGAIGSNLRALWYGADWVLGYAARVLPLRRAASVVAFDRYAHDYLVDPLRSRIRRDSFLVPAICALVPAPDRLYVCIAPLEVVRARKTELSEEESRLQIERYAALAARHPRARRIDTSGTVQQAVDAVLCDLFAEERA